MAENYEYVIVGSGAGGGTVAARLAEAGRSVLLLEAGGDPRAPAAGAADQRVPDDYDVPAFHAYASENAAMKWDFFVRHYSDDSRQKRDEKFVAARDGILYPRAGTLGGCTAHNAMIMVYPHNADWDGIAAQTGDDSWGAEKMRSYFERLEDCCHRAPPPGGGSSGVNPTRHGWNGWLQTEVAIPKSALGDRELADVILESVREVYAHEGRPLNVLQRLLEGQGDPNDWHFVSNNSERVCYTPVATRGHQRMGSRERVLEVARKLPDCLTIELNALATKVIFDKSNRAIGIEYLKGEKLYRAHAEPSSDEGERREVYASREVILAGGAFNTPQLLMLSGIGPRADLERLGIPVLVDLPQVGKNLQDRYEIGVVNRMNFDHWQALEGATFAKGDPIYQQWAGARQGVYATNGAVLAISKRSAPERALPDLFCFALLGLFKGYFPSYSKLFSQHLNYLTWAILKAHTNNTAGEVTLRSADPRDPPSINFRYFEEGNDASGEDLDSVVAGIKLARGMTAKLKEKNLIAAEEFPGEQLQSDDELREFVRANAWGHHASCTCAIGPVLSSDFEVLGTQGLRVVDASVFPRIPGFFIVSAVYMIGEKAADAILSS